MRHRITPSVASLDHVMTNLPLCRLLLCLLAVALHSPLIANDASAKHTRPNLLILMADDLTFTDIGCYGNPQARTPHLDHLATEGLRFKHCFNSAPTCAPTRMSLHTGLHPVHHGAYVNHSRVYPDIQSMPHYLAPLGYRVAIAGKRHEAPADNFPYEFLGGQHHDRGHHRGIDLDLTVVRDFFEAHPDRPWCLTVASNQPHTPWNRGDPTPWQPESLTLPPYMVDTPETREQMTRYYAEITWMDQQMGQVLADLEASGQAERTLVIFLSEQGSNFPFCKWNCYEKSLGSAAIVRWPGQVQPGRESDALIQYVDVLPTFIELAGGDPTAHDLDGQSLVPLLRGETDTHHTHVFGMHTNKGSKYNAWPMRTVRDTRWRLIWNPGYQETLKDSVSHGPYAQRFFDPMVRAAEAGDTFARQQVDRLIRRPEFELYDLDADPWEMNNLAQHPEHAATVATLKAELDAWMAQQGDAGMATEAQAPSRR